MGLRFRRRISLIPGVRLNVGLRGISASIGRRGAWLTLKPGRAPRATVGLPGTGISYSSTLGSRRDRHGPAGLPAGSAPATDSDPDGELAAVHLTWLAVIAAGVIGAVLWIYLGP